MKGKRYTPLPLNTTTNILLYLSPAMSRVAHCRQQDLEDATWVARDGWMQQASGYSQVWDWA